MDEHSQLHELRIIIKEYKSLFSRIELVTRDTSSNFRLDSDDYYANILNKKLSSGENYINIRTKDNKDLKVTVSIKGWCQIENDSKNINESERLYYETFEALMCVISPDFQIRFNQSLTNKLHGLLNFEKKSDSKNDNFNI